MLGDIRDVAYLRRLSGQRIQTALRLSAAGRFRAGGDGSCPVFDRFLGPLLVGVNRAQIVEGVYVVRLDLENFLGLG